MSKLCMPCLEEFSLDLQPYSGFVVHENAVHLDFYHMYNNYVGW